MRKSFLAVLAILATSTLIAAQGAQKTETAKDGAAPAAAGLKTTDQVFKNIKTLKGAPADQLLPTMRYFNASLGVECNFCHVTQPKWAPDKDDKEEKRTARLMIEMTEGINQGHFKGRPEVGCATCHGGLSHPRSAGPLVEDKPKPPQFRPARGQQLPSVEEIEQAYEKAIGGQAAIQKLSTLTAKATVSTSQGQTLQAEIVQKAPDKRLSIITLPNGQVREQGFNGATGWAKNPRGVNQAEGPGLTSMKIDARFDHDLMPVAGFANARVAGTDVVDGHECYVIFGQYADKEFGERLYFDRQSGLLLRRVSMQRTLLGPLVDSTEYSDYKEVQGVRVAFTTKHSTPEAAITAKMDTVEFNQSVPDSKFAPPASEGGSSK
jgi:hypothetical protein